MLQIYESGMTFGSYRPEQVYKIENSQVHSYVGTGVKSVEFVLLRGENKIFFIEAKSSSPKSETSWERYLFWSSVDIRQHGCCLYRRN